MRDYDVYRKMQCSSHCVINLKIYIKPLLYTTWRYKNKWPSRCWWKSKFKLNKIGKVQSNTFAKNIKRYYFPIILLHILFPFPWRLGIMVETVIINSQCFLNYRINRSSSTTLNNVKFFKNCIKTNVRNTKRNTRSWGVMYNKHI